MHNRQVNQQPVFDYVRQGLSSFFGVFMLVLAPSLFSTAALAQTGAIAGVPAAVGPDVDLSVKTGLSADIIAIGEIVEVEAVVRNESVNAADTAKYRFSYDSRSLSFIEVNTTRASGWVCDFSDLARANVTCSKDGFAGGEEATLGIKLQGLSAQEVSGVSARVSLVGGTDSHDDNNSVYNELSVVDAPMASPCSQDDTGQPLCVNMLAAQRVILAKGINPYASYQVKLFLEASQAISAGTSVQLWTSEAAPIYRVDVFGTSVLRKATICDETNISAGYARCQLTKSLAVGEQLQVTMIFTVPITDDWAKFASSMRVEYTAKSTSYQRRLPFDFEMNHSLPAVNHAPAVYPDQVVVLSSKEDARNLNFQVYAEDWDGNMRSFRLQGAAQSLLAINEQGILSVMDYAGLKALTAKNPGRASQITVIAEDGNGRSGSAVLTVQVDDTSVDPGTEPGGPGSPTGDKKSGGGGGGAVNLLFVLLMGSALITRRVVRKV